MKTNVHKIDKWGKLGTFLYQFRYTVIVALLLLAIVLGIFAPKLPGVLGGDGFQTEGDYQKTKEILDKDLSSLKIHFYSFLRRKRILRMRSSKSV